MKKLIPFLLCLVLIGATTRNFHDTFEAAVSNAAATYSVGDVIGGLLSFEDTDRRKTLSGIVKFIGIRDKDNQHPNYHLILFECEPVNSTFTDNLPVDVDADDLACIAGFSTVNGDSNYISSGLVSQAGRKLGFRLRSGTILYGILRARNGVTYSQPNSLNVLLAIEED